jgi:hypothetical protein
MISIISLSLHKYDPARSVVERRIGERIVLSREECRLAGASFAEMETDFGG